MKDVCSRKKLHVKENPGKKQEKARSNLEVSQKEAEKGLNSRPTRQEVIQFPMKEQQGPKVDTGEHSYEGEKGKPWQIWETKNSERLGQ